MDVNMDSIMKKVAEYTKKLSGDVSLNTLFSPSFLIKHSQKHTAKEFFATAGIVSQDTFDAWRGTDAADDYVKTMTDFTSWNDMLSAASKIFAKKKQAALRDGTWIDESFNTGVLFKDIHVFLNFSVA